MGLETSRTSGKVVACARRECALVRLAPRGEGTADFCLVTCMSCNVLPLCTKIAHWLATAGRDKAVKVWRTDLSRPKCDTTINTVGPVSRVKWRPGNRAHLAR